jgi:hypothetical protein
MVDSMLVFYQRVLALRRLLFRTLPTHMTWSPSRQGVLLYEHGRLTVAVNFLARPVDLEIRGRLVIGSQPLVTALDGRLRLPANSGAWLDTGAHLSPLRGEGDSARHAGAAGSGAFACR